MANLLQNTLTLQTEYRIPIRMDLTVHQQPCYYEAYVDTLDSIEGERILSQVIADFKEKSRKQLELDEE